MIRPRPMMPVLPGHPSVAHLNPDSGALYLLETLARLGWVVTIQPTRFEGLWRLAGDHADGRPGAEVQAHSIREGSFLLGWELYRLGEIEGDFGDRVLAVAAADAADHEPGRAQPFHDDAPYLLDPHGRGAKARRPGQML